MTPHQKLHFVVVHLLAVLHAGKVRRRIGILLLLTRMNEICLLTGGPFLIDWAAIPTDGVVVVVVVAGGVHLIHFNML